MRPTQLEFADPEQWLLRLAGESDGYGALVRESRGRTRAAYRIARARCASQGFGEPQLEQLRAAVALLAARLGSDSILPIESLLTRTSPSVPAAAASAPPPAPSHLRGVPKSRTHASRASV